MNRDAPVVSVTVREGDDGDQRIDFQGRLISFEFEDNAKKADKATFKLDNFDLLYLDDKVWQRGQKLEVTWGYYPDRLHAPQEMIIKRVSGGRVLSIEAHAKSVQLNQKQHARAFENMTRSEVAEQIAQEHGYRGTNLHIDKTTKKFDVINQIGETDARFLTRLARREGFTFYIDATGFHWHDEEYDSSPVRKLIYYTDPGAGDIIDFQLESDLFRQPGKVKVKGKDPKTKKSFEVSGSDAETDRTELAEEVEVVDPVTGTTTVKKRMATEAVHHTSARTEAEAKKEADARFKKASRQRIKLRLDIVGDPELTAKRTVDVSGLGQYLSGRYYIACSRHKIANGDYKQQIDLRRGGPSKVTGKAGSSAGGKKNRKDQKPKSELYEKVDPVTGETSYHRREVK